MFQKVNKENITQNSFQNLHLSFNTTRVQGITNIKAR